MSDLTKKLEEERRKNYRRSLLKRRFQRRTRSLGVKRGGGGTEAVIAIGQSSPTNTGPINYTVNFGEPVTGFTNADVSFSGSTVGGVLSAVVSGGPSSYNVAVSGMTGSGTTVITIPSAAATITSTGEPTQASNPATCLFDAIAPTVTINQAPGQPDPTLFGPIQFVATFSEPVVGFTSSDVTITGTAGGTKVVTITGGSVIFTVSVTGMTTNGTVIASIGAGVCTDLAGNLNSASTSTDNTVTWSADTTNPTVTINQGAGQADPASASPIVFDVVFSEAVLGFNSSTISFAGSTVTGTLAASISGAGPSYTVSVTGMIAAGNVVASIPAGVVTDLAGNPNLVSTSTDNVVAWAPGAGAGLKAPLGMGLFLN